MSSSATNIDRFFDDEHFRSVDSSKELDFHDLPYLARPIIELVHAQKPDVVIAADRGARLLALTAIKSWKKRFPGERFPTMDGKINLARVTAYSAHPAEVRQAVHLSYARAGLTDQGRKGLTRTDGAPRIMLLDDWSASGDTLRVFIEASRTFGIPRSSITYATMCGQRALAGVQHHISDPNRDPRHSVWDMQRADEPGYIGVRFGTDPTEPIADPTAISINARNVIDLQVNNYYAGFTAAIESGQLLSNAD